MINLFGEDMIIDSVKRGRKRYITMQEMYGLKEGFKCKNCKHFKRFSRGAKVWFKCGLWYISNSEATDIRANATACSKYEGNGVDKL